MTGREPHERALAEVAYRPYWLDVPSRFDPRPLLVGEIRCDVAIVGAGFTGLWSALEARRADPSAEIAVIEAGTVASGATGRNGGFLDASLTHGLSNGAAHFSAELSRLEALGLANLDAIEATVRESGIDCGFERTGTIEVATAAWQARELAHALELALEHGHVARVLGRDEVRSKVASPTYEAGLETSGRTALVDPARLALGLASAAEATGVTIFERTEVKALQRAGGSVLLTTARGTVRAGRVILATNAYRPLVRRVRPYVLPVYDYVLVTEPLSPAQRASLGWHGRQGLSDGGNQFHYYRLTADDRVLFGGYDAIYHFSNGLRDSLDRRPQTFSRLSRHLLSTFPQLEGVRLTHAWGGAIDTCSRFCAFYGTAYGGRVAYATGFTGLGVGASRFAARVMVELLSGEGDLLDLELVRSRPVPFPPEPLRWAVVQATRASLASADRNEGRRNLWLRSLDKVGLGFAS